MAKTTYRVLKICARREMIRTRRSFDPQISAKNSPSIKVMRLPLHAKNAASILSDCLDLFRVGQLIVTSYPLFLGIKVREWDDARRQAQLVTV